MEATRARVGSLLEWLVAAGCILAVLAIGAVVVREFRTVSAVTPVIAHEEALPDPPASVPPRSVSVPVLLLPDGASLHVGDTEVDLMSHLTTADEVSPPSIDRTSGGNRVTRFYQAGAQRFVIVLQALPGDEHVRVAGIYVE